MNPPRKILLLRPRFLGDVILATGLCGVLKKNWPQTQVWFLTEAPYSEALRHHPQVDGVLSFSPRFKNDLRYLWGFYRELRRQKFDAVLDLFGNPRSVPMAFFSGAPVRVGFSLRGRSWAYNRIAKPASTPLFSGRRPVTEAYLDQVRALGLSPEGPYRTSLFVTEEERSHARKILARADLKPDEKTAVLAPGASWPAKRWPLERFRELGFRLKAEGIRPLFIFGPQESDLAEEFEKHMDKDWLYINQPSLRGLMAFIEAADVLVSNDAGPLHVGPALGTPTLGIFGPGEPEVWFPYGPPHQRAYAEIPCGHCGLDHCPWLTCMDHVEPRDLMEPLLRMARFKGEKKISN